MRLSAQQIESFVELGYVVLPGLFDASFVRHCNDKIWRELDADPEDPSSWPEEVIQPVPSLEAEFRAISSGVLDEPRAQLLGPDFHRGAGFVPVLNFPRFGPAEFSPHGFHIDGVGEASLFPKARFLLGFVYCSDVEPDGGAVAVRPGSHRQIFEHHMRRGTDPAGETDAPEGPDYAPAIPLAGEAGTAFLLHYLLAHGSSDNRSDRVRVSLNGKTSPSTPYRRRSGRPDGTWTPLDLTLRTDTLTPENPALARQFA